MSWIRRLLRVNIVAAFLFLFGAHGIMYFSLGTDNALTVALTAALVWTVVLGFVQLIVRDRTKT